jgi:hypothetical protein
VELKHHFPVLQEVDDSVKTNSSLKTSIFIYFYYSKMVANFIENGQYNGVQSRLNFEI